MPFINPPREVFVTPPKPLRETQGGYTRHNWVKTVCPLTGGMFSYYENEPYPFPGHFYVEAVEANNIMKRTTVAGIKSLKLSTPTKMLENILWQYCRVGDYANRNHYMKKQFYNKFSREMWDLTYLFFRKIGITHDTAYRTGRIVANLFEWEDAYRFRMQHIFTLCNLEELKKNPGKEIVRLGQEYEKRETVGIEETFLRPIKMLKLLLLIPKVKNAFLFAVSHSIFPNLQLDKADKYFCTQRSDYNFSLT